MDAHHVVHVLSSLKVGGAERFVIDLSELQRQQEMSVSIASFGNPADPLVEVCGQHQLPVTHITGSLWGKYRRLYHLTRNNPILHVHSPAALRAMMPFLLTLGRHLRLVYTRHGAAPLAGKRWQRVHNLLRHRLHQITFVSEDGRNQFLSTYPWESRQCQVIENGIALPEISTPPQPQNPIRLGMVGRLVPIKHQIGLLQALETLSERRQQFTLDVFGDGPCRQELESFCQTHLSDMEVHFHGNVSDRHRIYDAMDVLVVTSQSEGLSIAMLEAMARQIPCIATAVGGNPRLVEDGHTGSLVDYDNPTQLASRLSGIQENPEQLVRWGIHAREWVARYFSIERTAACYQQIYQQGISR
ncbi:N-acetyl-alpha-D-glucosaminyl L-malate synthase [Saliniradius amylolyticus]|uniref:N-acetyl-alpha-D-glucosaminyl L-malate synthase n=1 Tax=Saliniradius amylolyticus TaxID=2183582 RepID=A0A2S2E322_9ALTE|nr:glycosyltransferase family 4 protein [Saliniradius amylolyticus]AWL11650.1 N-acetyl-alpha-D-glucosaminyl L-malate synthase [Saliniradius amylolyticus]